MPCETFTSTGASPAFDTVTQELGVTVAPSYSSEFYASTLEVCARVNYSGASLRVEGRKASLVLAEATSEGGTQTARGAIASPPRPIRTIRTATIFSHPSPHCHHPPNTFTLSH